MQNTIIPMLSLNGLLMNAFMGNAFVDKETGAVTPATLKVQVLCDVPQKGGDIKKELVTMGVKDESMIDTYHSLMGKMIRVPVGVMAQGRVLNFWVLPNSKPELFVAAPSTTSASSSPPSSSSAVKSPLGGI